MELKLILEALLFASQKPLNLRELRDTLSQAADKSEDLGVKAFKKVKEDDLLAALGELEKEYAELKRSYVLSCVAGSWQFFSQPDFAPWLKAMMGEKNRPARLSQPALETLTIISYRQPITKAEAEQIRGVSVDGVLQTLMDRGLVEAVGRAEVVGRPMTYGTTPLFLEYFGLRNLDELPGADELRRIVVQKPEALVTADPGAPGTQAVPDPTAQPAEPEGETEEAVEAAAQAETSPEKKDEAS